MLTAEDHEFFRTQGYLVIPAVPLENVARVKAETWSFLAKHMGVLQSDPETWSRHSGMLLMNQSQGEWNNRQHSRVYGAFAELLGRRDLWCSFDMMNVQPPLADMPGAAEGGAGGDPLSLHWDLSDEVLRGEKDQGQLLLQGEILIEDSLTAGSGGYTTVPGWVRQHAQWVAALPAGGPIERPQLRWQAEEEGEGPCGQGRWVWPEAERLGLEVVEIRGRAGDLLI